MIGLSPALTLPDFVRSSAKSGWTITTSAASPFSILFFTAGDVVIVQPDFADDLTKSGNVSAGDRPIIAHVGVGLGNRKDSPVYDISTTDKLKSALLSADLIVFNSVKNFCSSFSRALAT